MAESEFTQNNVSEMRAHLRRLEDLTRLTLALNLQAPEALEADFRAKKGAAKVYLCLGDGPADQTSLKKLTGQSQANISKICGYLSDLGVITSFQNPTNKKSKLFARNPAVERALRVSKIAKKVEADEAKKARK